MITKQEKLTINGSNLFFFKTKIKKEKQLEIIRWYLNLDEKEKEYVDTLIQEGKDEAKFFLQEGY